MSHTRLTFSLTSGFPSLLRFLHIEYSLAAYFNDESVRRPAGMISTRELWVPLKLEFPASITRLPLQKGLPKVVGLIPPVILAVPEVSLSFCPAEPGQEH